MKTLETAIIDDFVSKNGRAPLKHERVSALSTDQQYEFLFQTLQALQQRIAVLENGGTKIDTP